MFTLSQAYTHSFEADINPQTQTLQVELEDVERSEWAAAKVKHEDAGKRRTSMKIRRKKKEGKREQG